MEQSIETTNSSLYSLHIRISSDGLSLSVFDELNTMLSMKKVTVLLVTLNTNEIIEIIKKETQLYYKSIKLIYESDIYTVIPDSIFKPENVQDFLYLQHKSDPKNQILYNKIPSWDIVIAFAIPTLIQHALYQVFPYTNIEHHLSFVLTDKIKLRKENSIYIWVRPKMMDVIVLKNGKLHLMSSYTYQTPEDFAYFTLNIFEQLSLDIEKCKVFLLNGDKKPELQKTLEQYLKVGS